jgi:competence protein ComK
MVARRIYLINKETKAILTKDLDQCKAIIYEGQEVLKLPYPTKKILEESCLVNGASLQGRLDNSKHILQATHNLPIIVDRKNGIYFFPTASIKSEDCVWLAYHHIEKIIKSDDKTYVLFKDGTGIFVNASYYKVDRQKKLTSELIVQSNRDKLF